jgi:1-pyrroline-5-carboxylate dehydrogenase
MNGNPIFPRPGNEPVLTYAPGTPERSEIMRELDAQAGQVVDIPLVIDGEEIRTGDTFDVVMPHAHGHVIARAHRAGPQEVEAAVAAALEARHDWSRTPWEERAAVFMRAADMLAGPRRQVLNAATILGQSKTVFQSEIDAVTETADFFRFNSHFAEIIDGMQPLSEPGVWNHADYRPLEGFVYAVSPFNFTAIGANLSSAPALMGNVVLWKPAHDAVLASHYVMRLFMAAGLPPGVINFIPGDPVAITRDLLARPSFAGIHFTGSTQVFQSIWKTIGDNISRYKSYPRIVAETGGKDFIVAHPSAEVDALRTAIIRGAFEYQGQKCSAASRAYVPKNLWPELSRRLIDETASIAMGDPRDFTNFMTALIDERAFMKVTGYIEQARGSSEAEILVGGESDRSEGWFVRPTIIRAHRPDYVTMCEEIFGPVLSAYVYDDADWADTLALVDSTSPYGLTGSVFARDRVAIQESIAELRDAAGNFYVNDKPTGAVVGHQPFGGARASGTNDKAGSLLNLLRWVSARSIKETFVPPTDYRYPFMERE